MSQNYIQEYYHLQYDSFCNQIKAVVEAIEKILDIKDNLSDQQRAALHGLRTICSGQLIDDIKCDIESGNVTMETVEKRVQLDINAGNILIDLLNPSPIGKIFLELILAEHTNVMRMNLMNQVMWANSLK